MPSAAYLIVEQQQPAPEKLPELLKELAHRHQLDSYQCRQRLLGRGLSLLTKGPPEFLENVSTSLTQGVYRHWLVTPTRPDFAPQVIRGLQVTSEQIIFSTRRDQIAFQAGCRILAVFADLSGTLREQSVKQLLSSHAYRGRDQIRHLADKKVHQTILQGRPVIDLYRLDENGRISAAVRILPGKFDPSGLGDRATLSSRQNLQRILELAADYAGELTLHTDFGLVNLPGCELRSATSETSENLRRNLVNLTRYGWLMADVLRSDTRVAVTASESSAAEIKAALGTALPTSGQDLAVGQAREDSFLFDQVHTEVKHSFDADQPPRSSGTDAAETLPPPPAAQSRPTWRHPGFWFGGCGATLAILLFFIFELGSGQQLNRAAEQALSSGAVPAVIAVACLWYGFFFLRQRRHMQNTPTSRVRSLAMGMVEVKGRALRRYALVSPMAQIPCVYYRLTRYRRQGKDRQWKVSSISTSNNVPFALEDDTGKVTIDPAGCRVRAGSRHEGTPGGGAFHSWDDDGEKWVEEVITDGTLLYVLGYASVQQNGAPDRHQRRIKALRELKRDRGKLARFDTDGDGRINQEEWDAARSATEDEILQQDLRARRQRKKQEEHIVIGKKHGRPLIISETHSEEHLAGRYLAYSSGLFAASALAIGGAIYLLLNFFA